MKQFRYQPVPFDEMPYTRPDAEAQRAALVSAAEAMKSAKDYPAARKAFFDLQDAQEEFGTMFSLCSVRATMDTTDVFYEGEIRWLREESAKLIPLKKAFDQALADSPFRSGFEKEFGPQMLKMVDAGLRTADERIVPDVVKEGELTQKYQKDSAVASAEFRGEKCNFYGLLKHMESTDRTERAEAFRVWAALYAQIAPELDETYAALVELRNGMSEKLGFKDYTDLCYLKRRRFDYTREDAANFRRQIREIVTPAVAAVREKQRRRLGVEKLQWYDEALLYPEGNADPIGSRDELVEKAGKMYREMSGETGEFFDFMRKYRLFDLDTRPGKRMGGYMTSLPGYGAPFIFSNFNGTSADVDVLTHEAGHAFQGYLAMRSIPVAMLRGSTSEINEIHSMTMEHFAYPWMDSFFGENSEKYIASHLIGALAVLPYMCCVDEFQHEVYAHPEYRSADWRKAWRRIEKAYMPWRSYDGEPFLEEGGFWMQKQHIFLYPFYYIDYALAQMCAFQFYGLMKTDREKAWRDYLRLCRAGGTMGYFDLLKLAGLDNPFADGAVEKSVGHVLREIDERY